MAISKAKNLGKIKLAPLVAAANNAAKPSVTDAAGIQRIISASRRLANAYAEESRRLAQLPESLKTLHHQPLLERLGGDPDDTAIINALGLTNDNDVEIQIIQPEPDQAMNLAEVFAWLTLQYQNRQRFPLYVHAIGFKRFWRPVLSQFVQGSIITHGKRLEDVPSPATAIIWGRQSDATRKQADDINIKLIELEDGFLRSVGLGAEFAKPLSWIADSQTLYFDATLPSDLETLFNKREFTEAEKQRASKLRQRMVTAGISKYNTGRANWQRPAAAIKQNKDVVLVIGQVEQDASIRFGAPQGSSNLKLLKTVRALEGDAFIVYKPHPDVVAGARAEGTDENQAFNIADIVVTDANITEMLAHIDRMHVMTSLAGFEALLHDVEVICHGMPFYAGWGLTTDIQKLSRRGANPDLDSLVFAALIAYPIYVSRATGYYCNAEQTLQQLANWRAKGEGKGKVFRKTVRKILNMLRGGARA